MPYIISPIIKESFTGMWFEGSPYTKKIIYDINSNGPKSPPVNYYEYNLKPHSLPHIEGSAHTQKNGKTIEQYFENDKYFWGKALVVKLKGNLFLKQENNIYVWEVSLETLQDAIQATSDGKIKIPERLLLTVDKIPLNDHQLHDPNYVLILSKAAAEYLISNEKFCLYGTTWKSSDYCPGSKDRPIHNTLFKNAVILECLDLKHVPEGEYIINAFPIPLQGASESPVCPVLFTKDELKSIMM